MRDIRSHQHGFTLVELLAATAITGVLIILIMTFFINAMAQITINSARGDLLREAQISLDTLTQDVRLSSNAYATSSLLDDNAPGETTQWEGDDDTLILGTAAQDSDRNILFADALHYTAHKNNNIYYTSNGTLYRRTLAAEVDNNAKSTTCPPAAASSTCPPDSVLAKNVESFTVRYFDGNEDEVSPDDARSVEVTLELATVRYKQPLNASYTTRTVFRNE